MDFDAVVTNQAVHELRHKRYAAELHKQVRAVLKPGGIYLVCDHFCGEGGMGDDQLYMTVAEQKAALEFAGYASVDRVLLKDGMVLHRAS
jgi:predicted methyltransferase